jgi:hypothetical protein
MEWNGTYGGAVAAISSFLSIHSVLAHSVWINIRFPEQWTFVPSPHHWIIRFRTFLSRSHGCYNIRERVCVCVGRDCPSPTLGGVHNTRILIGMSRITLNFCVLGFLARKIFVFTYIFEYWYILSHVLGYVIFRTTAGPGCGTSSLPRLFCLLMMFSHEHVLFAGLLEKQLWIRKTSYFNRKTGKSKLYENLLSRGFWWAETLVQHWVVIHSSRHVD